MSHYDIQVRKDEEGEFETVDTRSKKESAQTRADELHAEDAGMFAVRVITDAGTVVYELESIVEAEPTESDDEEAAVVRARTRPWTRTEIAKGFEAPEVEGYTLAYTRVRTMTGVYRANDKSGWLVLDTRDGTQTEVKNTTEAREITNELEAAYKEARTKEKAAEKEAKAKEIADKKAARELAKKEKEDAKKAAAETKAEEEAAKETTSAA